MAQTGLHTLIAFKFLKNKNHTNWFLYAILTGSIIPDIDIVLNSIYKIIKVYFIPNSYYLNSNYLINYDLSIFHSIISAILIYLFILIYYELKKDNKILNFGNGLFLGLLIHIFIDIFLYLRPVQIFWPLNYAGINPINIWESIHIPFKIVMSYLAMEFMFFRYLSYKLIKILIIQNDTNTRYILGLSKWMKIQGLLFILFIFYFNLFKINHTTFIIYNFCLNTSIIFSIIILYLLRHTLIDYFNFKKNKPSEKKINLRPTSIDNLG